MSDLKAYVLFPGAAKNPLYSGWLEKLDLEAVVVKDYDTDWLPPEDAGIVITHNHYRWEEISVLRSVIEKTRVPLLILVDGILEYRNSFDHPDLPDGSMFQPLIGHKVACLGASQLRWIESWGNVGRCELVGLPRLDHLLDQPPFEIPTAGPFRLLVATARTPWFNDQQRDLTYDAMRALKSTLDEMKNVHDRPVEIVWRMSEELHHNLRAPGYVARPGSIQKALNEVHAVVTTPSTLQLEAAAMGLPVAVVDFFNAPQMTPLAWTISQPKDVVPVLNDLAKPPPARMLAQNVLLDDALQLHESAASRMSRLVSTMVEIGKEARANEQPIEMPSRILTHPANDFAFEQVSASRSQLYPDNPVFQNEELENLRTELAAARHEMGDYPEKFFRQRSANQRLRGYINWLRLLVRNRAAKVDELSEQIGVLQRQLSDRAVRND